MVAAETATAGSRSRQLAVEREAHSIEDAGLTRAGRTVEQEQPASGEGVEVDVLPVGEWTERRHRERMELH
jgi:hypothetical protein